MGIVIYSAFVSLGSIRRLWKSSDVLPHHVISKYMSQVRWEQIKRFLHISPPDIGGSFFNKLEPLTSHIRGVSKRLYIPSSKVSEDEFSVRFKGRLKLIYKINRKLVFNNYSRRKK